MKIDTIKINGFGKIKNKEIVLNNGINIIYGENESGKSTILKFIETILFGISKNKNGKNKSDFDQYKPWDDYDFSGKIKYTLENGEQYEVFREFKKKNPVIYNACNEDISKQFKIDKSKGINFFEEQIGVDYRSFTNTAMIGQQKVKLEKADTNTIIQKISNLVLTGDDNVSFKKSMEKLNKMQNEMVGTERTKQKPINIVESNIRKLLEERKTLIFFKKNKEDSQEDSKKIQEEIEILQEQKEILKKTKQTANSRKIKNIEQEFKRKSYIFSLLFLVIVAVVLFVMLENNLIAVIPVILAMLDIWMIIKAKTDFIKKEEFDDNKIEKELENSEVKINDLKLQSHILQNEKVNIDEKLEALAKMEEDLEEQKQRKSELMSLDVSFSLAKECLEEAYDEIKRNISPKFEQKLCEMIVEITDGKYKNIAVNDEAGLNIEVENGAYMPVENLSVGTIDEMYLALRLSTLAEISKENLPIILDESFAYFDNERLKNILCYLQDKNYNNQIIIFTCSNREEKALNELKIEYHRIVLEK